MTRIRSMRLSTLVLCSLALPMVFGARAQVGGQEKSAVPGRLRFEVSVRKDLLSAPEDGRLFIVLGRSVWPEPRLLVGQPGLNAVPLLARDVKGFGPDMTVIVDERAVSFPLESASLLPAGDYHVQAVFDSNMDLKTVNAPGNLYSEVHRVSLGFGQGSAVRLELKHEIPPETLPPDTALIRYLKLRSDLLSRFHGRDIYLRAGIILPRDFDREPERRYPLRVHIGGYGDRFTSVQSMMSEGSTFHRTWLADPTPRMILLHLDGDGPYGDCYQVNSANNGPYGDAVTRELIPFVEQKFRAIGQPHARVLDGGSTGGWVATALQVFYPDFFNGTWSFCPDSLDFRAFQLINIYQDRNAYVNAHGFDRPSARDLNGDVRFTIRHECQMENALGFGDRWTMSGEQWGAWNAAYGPRGADGHPVPLWDPRTGEIDHEAAEQWKSYDLRLVLERNWKTLGPKLHGKIRIWVGEADNYFLNNAVHLLDEFLSRANPAYGGKITYAPGRGHCWIGLTESQMMQEMAAAIEKGRP